MVFSGVNEELVKRKSFLLNDPGKFVKSGIVIRLKLSEHFKLVSREESHKFLLDIFGSKTK